MAVLAVSAAAHQSVQAGLVYWDSSLDATTTDFLVSSATMNVFTTAGTAGWTSHSELLHSAGTGAILDFDENGTGNLNGSSFTLKVTMGRAITTAFSISYLAATRAESTGGTPINTWEYSVDGGRSYTAFGTITVGKSPADYTVSTSVLSVGSGASIWFRNTLSGASALGAGGDAEFDNISIAISPVPEPVPSALAVFGLLFVGAKVTARLRARPKSTGPPP